MLITLRAARVNQGLTQKQAGEKLGVSEDVISSWERGVSFPNVIMLKKIEDVYKVGYNDIIFLPKESV